MISEIIFRLAGRNAWLPWLAEERGALAFIRLRAEVVWRGPVSR